MYVCTERRVYNTLSLAINYYLDGVTCFDTSVDYIFQETINIGVKRFVHVGGIFKTENDYPRL
jgi:hypothetical protein